MKEKYIEDDSKNSQLINDPETISKISTEIFAILKTKDEVEILSKLYKPDYKNIDLTLCIDPSFNNNTILISLVYYNLTNVIINLLSSFSHLFKSSQDLLPYLNQKNSKGYNALLYSAFRGNLEIFKKLIELGVDINVSNSSGLNALHLAAQGNHPNIIVFLMEKCGFDINSKDNNGSNALHWGINENSRQAVDYLVYYNIDIKAKDKDGETALGIAHNKANQYFINKFNGDFSIFINKESEENNEDKEHDLDKNINNNENIRNNQNNFFNKFWGTKSINMAAFPFILIMFALEGANQVIILKGYYNLYMSLVSFILFFLLLFFYYITSKSDPGEIMTKYLNSLLLLAEQGEDLKNICPWCINNINENTYHCFLCNKCFEYQEFHDIFLNNCIGKRNFQLYLNFLYYLTIVSCFKLFLCFLGFFLFKGEKSAKAFKLIIPQIIMTSGIIIFSILKIKEKTKNKNIFLNFGNNETKLNNECNNNNENNKGNINIQMTTLENSE